MVCAALALPAGASASPHPHLDGVAAYLRLRAPGTENKLWWLSYGNHLPDDWLLQTPDCWGSLNCGEPPRGGARLLTKITTVIAGAQRSVEIDDLFPPPNGRFLDAVTSGLRQSLRRGYTPQVRILAGYRGVDDPRRGESQRLRPVRAYRLT